MSNILYMLGALVLICFLGLKYASSIRNLLGIRKDWAETQKAKLEEQKIRMDMEGAASRVHIASDEDIKTFDPKTRSVMAKAASVLDKAEEDFIMSLFEHNSRTIVLLLIAAGALLAIGHFLGLWKIWHL